MSQVTDDICAYAERKLAGSGLTSALVLWKPGEAADPKSVGLCAHPSHQAEAPIALITTALAAAPAPARLDALERIEAAAIEGEARFNVGLTPVLSVQLHDLLTVIAMARAAEPAPELLAIVKSFAGLIANVPIIADNLGDELKASVAAAAAKARQG